MKMGKGLECNLCKERNLFIRLEKRRLRGDIIVVFTYLKGCHKEGRTTLLTYYREQDVCLNCSKGDLDEISELKLLNFENYMRVVSCI